MVDIAYSDRAAGVTMIAIRLPSIITRDLVGVVRVWCPREGAGGSTLKGSKPERDILPAVARQAAHDVIP